MAASSKIPLYLFQVLEEEYVALHGEELNDLDWNLLQLISKTQRQACSNPKAKVRILGSYIMDQMCGLEDKDLQLKQALDKAVAKLLDPCDGEPADPLLKDWWESCSRLPHRKPINSGA